MKKIATILATLALGITLTGITARADEKTTPLGDKMKVIAGSVKKLKSQITNPAQKDSSIQLVEAAEKAAQDARTLVPAHAADIPEADRAKFISDYQAQLDVLIKQFGTIDDALKADKYDDAQKGFNDLAKIKQDGHKAFIKPQN